MKKRFFSIILVFILIGTLLIPTGAFASNPQTPNFPNLPSGYHGWMKTNSYQSSDYIDELTYIAIEVVLCRTFQDPISIGYTIMDILDFFNGPANLYYINETYQAINANGEFMKFEFRKYYSDRARTQFVSSLQSEVTTGIRLTSDNNEETI